MRVNEKEIDCAPIFEMIKSGKKIEAIQYVIEQTGSSLKEAYEVVQAEIEKLGSFTLSTKKVNPPLIETKRVNFKYSNRFFDWLLTVGMFVICFGALFSVAFLIFEWLGNQIEMSEWKGAIAISTMLVCLIVAVFAAGRLSAIITEIDGEAIFRKKELELVLKRQNIEIEYKEVVRIEFEKVVGGDWSFLPVGKLTVFLTNNRKIKIASSRREAQKLKRKHGLVWKYKLNKDGSAPVPDVLLWKVCVELSERTGRMMLVNEIIDNPGG